jgi:hypothetical protein
MILYDSMPGGWPWVTLLKQSSLQIGTVSKFIFGSGLVEPRYTNIHELMQYPSGFSATSTSIGCAAKKD